MNKIQQAHASAAGTRLMSLSAVLSRALASDAARLTAEERSAIEALMASLNDDTFKVGGVIYGAIVDPLATNDSSRMKRLVAAGEIAKLAAIGQMLSQITATKRLSAAEASFLYARVNDSIYSLTNATNGTFGSVVTTL